MLDGKETDKARDLVELLFETALITSGFQVRVMGGRRGGGGGSGR